MDEGSKTPVYEWTESEYFRLPIHETTIPERRLMYQEDILSHQRELMEFIPSSFEKAKKEKKKRVPPKDVPTKPSSKPKPPPPPPPGLGGLVIR